MIRRVLWLATSFLMLTSGLVLGQTTSTFNGRVLDQGDAVLPGVTITATNTNTGVVRTTVTNAEGGYLMPGLEPGIYSVKTELAGFQPSERRNVTLGINATLTLDFKLALAGVNETLTVTGEAPMIEVTQSKVASTIQATELQNLPMITRTISGMLELLPGAAAIAPMHRSKQNVGSVSYRRLRRHERDSDRRRRRQPRQPVRRTAHELHGRGPRAVPARHEPVQRRRRAWRGRGADDGDQVGHQ